MSVTQCSYFVFRHFQASQQAHEYGATLKAQDSLEEDIAMARVLQVMRAIIHNARIMGDKAPKFQSALAQYKLVLSAAELLSSDNPIVFRETLALLVAVLDSGNADAQTNFVDHFYNTREETFFRDISSRIKDAMEWIREVCYVWYPTILTVVDLYLVYVDT